MINSFYMSIHSYRVIGQLEGGEKKRMTVRIAES